MTEISIKRKAGSGDFHRRIRPRLESEESASGPSSGEDDDDSVGQGSAISRSDDGEEEDEDVKVSEFVSNKETGDLKEVSFGALAKAQALLGNSRKNRAGRAAKTAQALGDDDDPGDGGVKATVSRAPAPKTVNRTNKHAPQEISSSRPVSRKREILGGPDIRKPRARDPRFDAAVGSLREDKFRRAYAFLDDYRESEMNDLRMALKKTKDPVQKEELQRALMRMESRKKAQNRKDRETALLEEHRAKEKELVSKGKRPFFLKKSEVKKKLLVEQFDGMKKRQVDKVIERKRKKIVAKERKELRMERRSASGS